MSSVNAIPKSENLKNDIKLRDENSKLKKEIEEINKEMNDKTNTRYQSIKESMRRYGLLKKDSLGSTANISKEANETIAKINEKIQEN